VRRASGENHPHPQRCGQRPHTWTSGPGVRHPAPTTTDDLIIATARAVDSMYMEWRRLHQGGMRQVHQDWYALHEQTRHCRVYVSTLPPGFLQTPAFATALAERCRRRR
jgi:hypothetical protein